MSSNTAETVKRARELRELGVYPMVLMSQMATLIMDIIAGTYQVIEASADLLFDGRSYCSLGIHTRHWSNNLDNITRFLILAREPIIQGIDKPHKTSIVFTLEEGPRVLFNGLVVFALRDINLSKVTFSTTSFYLSR
ncbi:unnamed protein product [Lactuca saligna]|uniref:Uncharacterized protein n=1 Tax=Lactuca saligna TaxID=75948 RepID=A0AA36EDA8_LACSI|nr:unnamed protein product [Lactuca saligna]